MPCSAGKSRVLYAAKIQILHSHTQSFALASPLYTAGNPVCTILNASCGVRNASRNRPPSTACGSFKRFAYTSSQGSNNTANSICNAADCVANCRSDELDTGGDAGILLTDRHRDCLFRSAVVPCFRSPVREIAQVTRSLACFRRVGIEFGSRVVLIWYMGWCELGHILGQVSCYNENAMVMS
jgi:hypothetical protein